VARMGEMQYAYKILFLLLKGRDHSEDISVDRKVSLN
jgi:hypothetical protein